MFSTINIVRTNMILVRLISLPTYNSRIWLLLCEQTKPKICTLGTIWFFTWKNSRSVLQQNSSHSASPMREAWMDSVLLSGSSACRQWCLHTPHVFHYIVVRTNMILVRLISLSTFKSKILQPWVCEQLVSFICVSLRIVWSSLITFTWMIIGDQLSKCNTTALPLKDFDVYRTSSLCQKTRT